MSSFGVNTEILPVSGITKETIEKAMDILKELTQLIEEDQEICKKGMNADLALLTGVRDKISDFSSRFYELIPLSQYKDQIAPPLHN